MLEGCQLQPETFKCHHTATLRKDCTYGRDVVNCLVCSRDADYRGLGELAWSRGSMRLQSLSTSLVELQERDGPREVQPPRKRERNRCRGFAHDERLDRERVSRSQNEKQGRESSVHRVEDGIKEEAG